jgi:hypothetical protein
MGAWGLLSCGGAAPKIARAIAALAACVTVTGCTTTRGLLLWSASGEAGAASMPSPISWSGQFATAQQGGDGGSPSLDVCPSGQVVVGYRGVVSNPGIVIVGNLQTLCGIASVGGAASDQVVVAPGAALPVRGTAPGTPWTQQCPTDQIVIGFSGRSGNLLDQIRFTCAHWIVSSSDAGPSLSIDSVTTLIAAGGGGGSAFPLQECPPGQMAVGSLIDSGDWIDAFGLVCGMPSIL